MRKQTRAILMLAGITLSGVAGAQTQKNQPATKKTDVNPASVIQPVIGAGTPGQITKWVGVSPTNFAVGDSTITEDKFANIGVGTTTPTSKFTVAGTIETTQGGVKFPDGSTQTTAGISSVAHDGTLVGNGTGPSPLGIAPGGVGTLQLANAAVTGPKIAGGAVGNLQLADASVTAGKIAAGAVGTPQLAGAAVTGPKIATGAVGNLQLADAAVTSAKIAAGAVGTLHIADDAVTGLKIAIAAVSTPQLADSAVTSPKLASGAVQTIHLADSSVTASKLGPGQVVKALNGLSDNVQLVAGSNITLTPSGNTLTISGTGQSGSTASQAFQITRTVTSESGSVEATFSVPAGKRLVIENVSARAQAGGVPECIFSMTTSINGAETVTHFFPAAFSQFDAFGIRRFLIGQAVRIYADGQVVLAFEELGASTVSVTFSISGYLVDL